MTKKSDGWSEDDEIILNGIIDDFGDGKTSSMLQESWLKSIKDRIQPQPKWSEEDEENLHLVLECFTVGQLGVAYCKVFDWLESIKRRLS